MNKKIKNKLDAMDLKVTKLSNENQLLIRDNIDQKIKLEGYLSWESELSKAGGIIKRRKYANYRIEAILLDRIRLTLYTLFEYKGLPPEIPSYMIEELFFDKGECLMWQLAGKTFVGTYVKDGTIDEYRRPIGVTPKYMNGKTGTKKIVGKSAVILRNTFTRMSTYKIIKPFIERLTMNFEALAQKLNASMTKWAVITDKANLNNTKAQLERMMDDQGYFAFIPTEGLVKLEQIQFYEEFKGSEYWEDFNSTLSLMYNQLGINTNPNEDKKERLLVDEININEQRVGLILESMIRSRLEALKEINEVLKLNIQLEVKIKEAEDKENENEETEDKEGGNNDE